MSTGTVRGEDLRDLRKRLNMRLVDVAGDAGITTSYLSKIEAGHKNPALVVAARIARALGVPLQSFYDIDPDSGVELIRIAGKVRDAS